MDEKLNILLNSEKNIESINVDNSTKIELSNKKTLINEYDIRNILSVTELFEIERQETQIYRIYGKIEYLSLLNGLRNSYNYFIDFFNPRFDLNSSKSIFNSFDFYLVRPAESGYTKNLNDSSIYNRYFKVVATPNQFDLFKAGFANNVFNEETYAFNFSVDVDISELTDEFGMPLTELFLYVQYKKSNSETTYFTKWSNSGVKTNRSFNITSLNVGDYVKTISNENIGDYIQYSKQRFWQTQITPQTFRIKTPVEVADFQITLTQTECILSLENIDETPFGTTYREYRQNLTFSIEEIQENDTTVFFNIKTETIINNTNTDTTNTSETVTIPAGQQSVTLSNVLCRTYENKYSGYWITTETILDYSLFTTDEDTKVDVTWKYNPFIPIRLRYFEDYLNRVNTGNTSYEVSQSIPEYATNIGNGNFIWREIMPEGYTDPLTGIGTNHPFVNKRRYVFSTIVLDITPDLDDDTTFNLFQNIWFDNDTEIVSTRPINDINEINKPCL